LLHCCQCFPPAFFVEGGSAIVDTGDVTQGVNQNSSQGQDTDVDQNTNVNQNSGANVNVNAGDKSGGVNSNDNENDNNTGNGQVILGPPTVVIEVDSPNPAADSTVTLTCSQSETDQADQPTSFNFQGPEDIQLTVDSENGTATFIAGGKAGTAEFTCTGINGMGAGEASDPVMVTFGGSTEPDDDSDSDYGTKLAVDAGADRTFIPGIADFLSGPAFGAGQQLQSGQAGGVVSNLSAVADDPRFKDAEISFDWTVVSVPASAELEDVTILNPSAAMTDFLIIPALDNTRTILNNTGATDTESISISCAFGVC
jgi:hypothetical protein